MHAWVGGWIDESIYAWEDRCTHLYEWMDG